MSVLQKMWSLEQLHRQYQECVRNANFPTSRYLLNQNCWRVRPENLCFNKPSTWFLCVLKCGAVGSWEGAFSYLPLCDGLSSFTPLSPFPCIFTLLCLRSWSILIILAESCGVWVIGSPRRRIWEGYLRCLFLPSALSARSSRAEGFRSWRSHLPISRLSPHSLPSLSFPPLSSSAEITVMNSPPLLLIDPGNCTTPCDLIPPNW